MRYISEKLRQRVKKRAGGFCEYCKAPEVLILVLEIDHIKPLADDGKTDFEHLCCACSLCNGQRAIIKPALTRNRNRSSSL